MLQSPKNPRKKSKSRVERKPNDSDIPEPCPFSDASFPTLRIPAFLGNLMRPVKVWDMIIIEGKVPINATSMTISLETTKNPAETVPFQFTVKFLEQTISCNAKISGEWGVEETLNRTSGKGKKMLLKRGKRFTFTLLMTQEDFLISINKKSAGCYPYRSKLKLVRTVRVSGDVYRVLRVDHRSIFPSPWPKYITPAMISFDAPERLVIGWVIVFGGIMYAKKGHSFDVRLFEMGTQRIRLLMRLDKGRISYYENCSGFGYDLSLSHETIQESNPLEHMKPFRIAIALAAEGFRIAINGELQTSYPYFSRVRAVSGLKLLEQAARVSVFSVDYVKLDNERCLGFAVLSKWNFCLT